MAEEKGKSIAWVIGMLMLAILGGAWVFAAGDYFQAVGKGPARDMWANAVAQLPNAPAVLGYVFKSRFWLVIAVAVALALAVALGVVLKRVERELEKPRRR